MANHMPDSEKPTSYLCGYIEAAVQQLNLPESSRDLLTNAYRELRVQIPVRRDSGEMDIFYGYRVQHNGALGPYKGGIRFHPEVVLNEVRDLASAMTWKNALMCLPFGGAKGGVICNPYTLSNREKEALMRGFTSKISLIIGPYRDIPAPDMNTNAQMMAWLMDEYGKKHGYSPAVVTGKPVELGGSLGRKEATGRGAFYLLEDYYKKASRSLNGATVALQGFGNVGYHVAALLENAGAKVVALANHLGGVYCEAGLDIQALKAYEKDNAYQLAGFADSSALTNEALLALNVDCLIPAALGHVIHEKNADAVQARVILECANLPVTPQGEKILEDKGVVILPDVLANAGGVTVSYFEWTQNLQQFQWEAAKVNQELKTKILAAFEKVIHCKETHGLNYRQACYRLAVERVHKASQLRGYTNNLSEQ
ncbi:MAG: Glu/Leu/Phe/Val dehydrogenase dimerization domain-containing protein [Cyanobacteria bacterium P01_H01_bin.74]